MKKMSFITIFMITLVVCSVPMYVFIRYIEGDDRLGLFNAIMTGTIISLLPSLLISIWWWNVQHQDEMDED
jgi:heme/copper-type cytochrome/quinol oxidase subunit 4